MGVRQRTIQANYLKVAGKFELLGTGFSELNESPSAQTTSKRYINQSSSSQTITGYEWSSAFTADQIASEKAIEHIRRIGEMQKIGADAETEYIIVDLDKPALAEKEYRARKFKVSIAIDSFDNNDGELGITGNFLGQSDPLEGTFNTLTNTFTEGFNEKLIEVPYSNTDTVSEISVEGIAFDDTADKFTNIPYGTTTFNFKDGTTVKTAKLGSSWSIT